MSILTCTPTDSDKTCGTWVSFFTKRYPRISRKSTYHRPVREGGRGDWLCWHSREASYRRLHEQAYEHMKLKCLFENIINGFDTRKHKTLKNDVSEAEKPSLDAPKSSPEPAKMRKNRARRPESGEEVPTKQPRAKKSRPRAKNVPQHDPDPQKKLELVAFPE